MEFAIGLILLIVILSFFPSLTPEERRAKEEQALKDAIKSDKLHETLDQIIADFRSPKAKPQANRRGNDFAEFMLMKQAYLDDIVWDTKRKETLSRDNYTCQSCRQSGIPLEVHHWKGYDQLPYEGIECLVSLCRSCHQEEHDIHGYPQEYTGYMEWNHPITKGK